MNLDKLFNIVALIVGVGLVTVIVTNYKGTSSVIGSAGSAFSSSLKTAMGR